MQDSSSREQIFSCCGIQHLHTANEITCFKYVASHHIKEFIWKPKTGRDITFTKAWSYIFHQSINPSHKDWHKTCILAAEAHFILNWHGLVYHEKVVVHLVYHYPYCYKQVFQSFLFVNVKTNYFLLVMEGKISS